jgi:hypothetical protein
MSKLGRELGFCSLTWFAFASGGLTFHFIAQASMYNWRRECGEDLNNCYGEDKAQMGLAHN